MGHPLTLEPDAAREAESLPVADKIVVHYRSPRRPFGEVLWSYCNPRLYASRLQFLETDRKSIWKDLKLTNIVGTMCSGYRAQLGEGGRGCGT